MRAWEWLWKPYYFFGTASLVSRAFPHPVPLHKPGNETSLVPRLLRSGVIKFWGPGRMGTPLGKWGPLLSNFRECLVKPHLDLSHRYLSVKVNKMEQSSSCLPYFPMTPEREIEFIHAYLFCVPETLGTRLHETRVWGRVNTVQGGTQL